VIEDGPWNDWESCWFNSLISASCPATRGDDFGAARSQVASIAPKAAAAQKQDLAAVIHLCGAAGGAAYAARGFRAAAGQRCGDHELRAYLAG